jgi:hypothetical protein
MIIQIKVRVENEVFAPSIKRDYNETLLHIEFGRTVEANIKVQISIEYVSFISMTFEDKQEGLILARHYNPLTKSTRQLTLLKTLFIHFSVIHLQHNCPVELIHEL